MIKFSEILINNPSITAEKVIKYIEDIPQDKFEDKSEEYDNLIYKYGFKINGWYNGDDGVYAWLKYISNNKLIKFYHELKDIYGTN